MSTTDCYEVYRGPCLCGNGEIVVNECSPDHPYIRASQFWWETQITCLACAAKYEVRADRRAINVLLKVDVSEKQAKGEEWHKKLREMEAFAEGKGYLDRLARHIDSLKSVAEVHRQITRFSTYGGTYQTFLRHFTRGGDTKGWVKSP